MTDFDQMTHTEPTGGTVPMIPIADASAADLRKFAVEVFGIDLSGSENKATIQKRLADIGFVGDKVPKMRAVPAPTALDEIELDEIPSWEGTYGDSKKLRRLTCINVMRRETPGGNQPVCTLVNGTRLDIPRGQDVVVPVEYVEVLIHAVERRWISDLQNGLTDYQDVPQFPFQFRPRPRERQKVEAMA